MKQDAIKTRVLSLHKQGFSYRVIEKETGVSRSTISRWVNAAREAEDRSVLASTRLVGGAPDVLRGRAESLAYETLIDLMKNGTEAQGLRAAVAIVNAQAKPQPLKPSDMKAAEDALDVPVPMTPEDVNALLKTLPGDWLMQALKPEGTA